MQRTMSMSSSHYATPYESPEMLRYPASAGGSRKRSHQEDFYDYQGMQQLQTHATGHSSQSHGDLASHSQYSQLPPSASSFYMPSQQVSPTRQSFPQQMQAYPTQHHHHRLPNQPPPNKMQRTGDMGEEHTSVVGQPGMPSPAARPKGPKLKFSSEDDALLVELKETKNLTWKQIADFFPGRSSGTLQVRYCTKLKAKTTTWTDDMVSQDTTTVRKQRQGT